MPTWAWVITVLGGIVIGGALVYVGLIEYLLSQFSSDN